MKREFLTGADISMLGAIEAAGGVFRDEGKPRDLVALMRSCGATCFRLRLFVNPNHQGGVVNDLPYTIALAHRIKAAGARFLLDFHYSDTWADPGHQIKPAAWQHLDFPDLVKQVEEYTGQVIAELSVKGLLPDIVQIGNEVTPGMLWPDGKLGGAQDREAQWEKFTQLLKAGLRGVKKALEPGDTIRTMLHIDRGGNWETTKWFFENINKWQVPFDLIGQSFYPFWHGCMQDLQRNLKETAHAFRKEIVVVETAYPHSSPEWWSHQKNMAWPISPEGQKQFVQELIRAVRDTPGGYGAGVLYWYPESIPVSGMRVWNGGATALFDEHGTALPALKCL